MKKYKLSEYVLKNEFGNDVYFINTNTNCSIQLVGSSKEIINIVTKNGYTVEEIVKLLLNKFDIDYETCMRDTNQIINDLCKLGFLNVL